MTMAFPAERVETVKQRKDLVPSGPRVTERTRTRSAEAIKTRLSR